MKQLKTIKIYYLTVSECQESDNGLAGWSWNRVSHDAAIKLSPRLHHRKVWLGLADLLPRRLSHMAVGYSPWFLTGCWLEILVLYHLDLFSGLRTWQLVFPRASDLTEREWERAQDRSKSVFHNWILAGHAITSAVCVHSQTDPGTIWEMTTQESEHQEAGLIRDHLGGWPTTICTIKYAWGLWLFWHKLGWTTMVNWLLGDSTVRACVGVLLGSERALWCLLSVEAEELDLAFYKEKVHGLKLRCSFQAGLCETLDTNSGCFRAHMVKSHSEVERLSPCLGKDHGEARCGCSACCVQQGVRDARLPRRSGQP